MRPMTDAERALAEEAMAIVPVVLNSMGRSFPGIKHKLRGIDAQSVAYMAICRAAQTYDPDKSKVTTYFSSAIRNALLKELARSQRLKYDSPDRVPYELAEREAQRQSGRSTNLPAALSVLPAAERRLVASRYYYGMSIREISIVFKLNEKLVRARLKTAVQTLSQLLGSEGRLPE
jgi:RNA polymerase sigma factor (sigma-70 family)